MKVVEVWGFKWPRRPTAIARGTFLGEDEFGCWLGFRCGDPWWTQDRSQTGVFEESLVKLVPNGTFWTACFHPVDPVVDVDIVLPVSWRGHVLEEVDLELDVLRYADGRVLVRDRDAFEQVRLGWGIPEDIAVQAEAACAQILARVECNEEPFGTVGQAWLECFLSKVE
ncbi:MAG: DUF402 domain-containing protein [Chloroflexota bacterium]